MTGQEATTRGQATRARIVDTAAHLIHTRGVAASTQHVIEAAAGVGRSQMYHHFADRQDLLRAVVERNGRRLADATRTALESGGDRGGPAALEAWFQVALAANTASGGIGGCPLGSLSAQLAETDTATRDLASRMFQTWQEPLVAALQQMLQRGDLATGTDVQRLADQVMACLQGGLLLSQVRRDPAQLAQALDAARTLVLTAHDPRPTREDT